MLSQICIHLDSVASKQILFRRGRTQPSGKVFLTSHSNENNSISCPG
ncbi:unnamed protein product [Haemonchus placei]|uniref:Uncharacterized protein n=1 Tax=Haemonchus placei TaxID=6290 RepID=A0A0N4W8D8_HAEPC|nr:unnamed protein product [Haemonchus placei]